jgi:hypothetical protein
MARRSAARPRHARPARPLVTVLVDHPTICELADGTVLHPHELLPWLAEADIERVVFGPAGRVLDVGVRQRTFTGATRRAVEVRDKRCTHPSCDIPAERCQVDHLQPYEAGGPTVQTNGDCKCRYHHRRRHAREAARPPP